MKAKLLALTVVALMILAGGLLAVDAERPQGDPKKPGTDFSGPHYNLNIIGKKEGWNGNAGINPDTSRHTMFVPEYTEDWVWEDEYGVQFPGIMIWMSQGEEFAVLDGNAFDDGQCSFQLGPGKYNVYICAKAKTKDGQYTNIDGWVQYDDNYDDIPDWQYYLVGQIQVKGKKWWDITDELFLVTDEFTYCDDSDPPICTTISFEDEWIFDFMDAMKGAGYWSDTTYFWQYDNHGNKLVKLRFYEA